MSINRTSYLIYHIKKETEREESLSIKAAILKCRAKKLT